MGSLKLIFGLFAIVAVVYLLAELAPPYMSNYQFEDALKTEAQMSTYNNKSEDAIRDEVYKRAQDLDVPIVREHIKVQRGGVIGNGCPAILWISISTPPPETRVCSRDFRKSKKPKRQVPGGGPVSCAGLYSGLYSERRTRKGTLLT